MGYLFTKAVRRMNQFYMSTPSTGASQPSVGGDGSGQLKIQTAKLYSARLEMLGNQISQVKVAVNKQTVTVPLPVPQPMPPGIKPGQSVQVSFTTNKDGQPQVTLHPAEGGKTPPQTIKVSLSDAQLVNLMTLGKAFKANPDGSVQTQAKIILNNQNVAALKLPGLANALKLPQGVAELLKDSKTVAVSIQAKGNKIELQLSLDPKAANVSKANAKISLPLTADKVSQMVKQAINQSPDMALKVDTKTAGTTKVLLPNQQSITLPGKADAKAAVSIQTIAQREMSLKITLPTGKPAVTISLNRPLAALTPDAAQTTATQAKSTEKTAATTTNGLTKTAANLKPMLETMVQNVKLSAEKSLSSLSGAQNGEAVAPQAQPPAMDLKQQKEVFSKLLDPLIRLLLPKKLNWSEGLKSLAALEQQLPQSKSSVADADTNNKMPELKQLLSQLRSSIPDQNSPLTEKNIAAIIGQIINFNPAKVSPSLQPTPANAIANALQLLLGSKLVQQSEAKATPQLLQQLTSLLKPLTGKEAKTAGAMKTLTTAMSQAEGSSNSLKTLVGLQSGLRHQQLENVEKKLDGNTQLNLTLPLKVDNEIKELKIAISEEENKKNKNRKKQSIWQLNLTFDLNTLGKLLVNAKLKEGEVSMHLYAEQQKTLTLMEKFSGILERRLETQGVKINNIQSSLGKINIPKDNKPMNSILQITV